MTKKVKFYLKPRANYDMARVRRNLGLSQADIGQIMFLSRKSIAGIEEGITRPNGASTILYGIVLDEICKERGTTFEKVLNS